MPPLIVAALIVLLEAISLSVLFPVTHAYAARLGGGEVWTGLLFALVALPKVVFNPFWGGLADRYGRRPLLVLSSVGTLAGSIGWALAPDLAWLACARVVVGVFGAQQVMTTAIAADVSRPERRAAAMAVLGAAFGVAFTAGPPLGGWFAGRFGYAAIGWLCAGFQVVSIALSAFVLRETLAPHSDAATGRPRTGIPALLAVPGIPALLAVNTAMTLALSQVISAFGLFVERVYAGDVRQAGLLLGAFGLLTAVSQGIVRDLVARFGEHRPARGGLLLAAVGLALISVRPPLAVFYVALAAVALGSSLATPCVTALMSRAVGPAQQGGMFGLNQSTTGLGRGFGFLLGGLLFARFGPSGPFVTAAFWALVSAALLPAGAAQPARLVSDLKSD